jgi:hypothetical protein
MSSPQEALPTLGAENQGAPSAPAVAEGKTGTSLNVAKRSSSDEEMVVCGPATSGQGQLEAYFANRTASHTIFLPSGFPPSLFLITLLELHTLWPPAASTTSLSLPPSLARHENGATNQTSCGSCRPSCSGQCPQTCAFAPPSVAPIADRRPSGSQATDWKISAPGQLEAMGQKLDQIGFILDIIVWILHSDFLRLQLLEPIVGDLLANYPPSVEQYGIKGQSVYTALFNNIDMEMFTCKLCPYKVKDSLDDAITHHRVHFAHHPYLCSGTQSQWYVPSLLRCGHVYMKNAFPFSGLRFANQTGLENHQVANGH